MNPRRDTFWGADLAKILEEFSSKMTQLWGLFVLAFQKPKNFDPVEILRRSFNVFKGREDLSQPST